MKSEARNAVAAAFLLVCIAAALPAAAQSTAEVAARQPHSRQAPGVSLAAGSRYQAGGLHRFLWGDNYRRLWAAPIVVPTLDLRRYAGGLRPTGRGGGHQTISLHLTAADGHRYSFRSVDKNAIQVLPAELQLSIVGLIWQDEVSALFPAAGLLASPLLRAAGVPTLEPRLFVMPDDPELGEFRRDFSGMLGILEEWPTPPYDGAKEILGTEDVLRRVTRDPHQRLDTRAFLATRLMDVYLGDADRGQSQWLWLKRDSPGGVMWQPLGIDRDFAFVNYGGLGIDLVRHRYPKLVDYKGKYPNLIGLNWRASANDRRLLGDLDRGTWDSTAHALAGRLTDSAIDSSLLALPEPFRAIAGPRLRAILRERRTRLPEAARDFYRLLALDAEVHATAGNESVTATREPGSLELAIRGAGGLQYQRRFQSAETKEVRLHLSGGTDTLLIKGSGDGPGLRILSDSGTKVVSSAAHDGWAVLYAPKPVTAVVQGNTHLDINRRVYRDPDSVGSSRAPRDWGHWWWFSPVVRYDPDRGALIGTSTTLFTYGFRRDPYASRSDLLVGYGTTAGRFGGTFGHDFRLENRTTHLLVDVLASGADVRHFYGLGNNTARIESKSFYNVYGDQYRISAAVGWLLAPRLTAQLGPVVTYSSTDFSRGGLISQERPYGSGEFGGLAGQAGLDYDTRDAAAAATRGVHLAVRGRFYPAVWDVQSTFGQLEAEASTYLTASVALRPTLALRAGGQRVWGTFPYQTAAHIGGARTVRGLPSYRYQGDASAFGNAELRVPVSRLNLLAPFELGVFGLADAGRVWVSGESSDTWHSAFGGGISLAFLAASNTVTATIAHGEGQTGFYLATGFAF